MLSARPRRCARLRELYDAALARGVCGGRSPRPKIDIIDRDVDHLPATGSLHSGVGLVGTEIGAREVRIHHPAPFVERDLLRKLPHVDAGVVHEDVEPAAAVERGRSRGAARKPRRSRRLRSRSRRRGDRRKLVDSHSGLRRRYGRDDHRRARRDEPARERPSPMPPLPPVTTATLPFKSKHLVSRGDPTPCVARRRCRPAWACRA